MMQMKHWQDPVNVVLGAWLVLSPWALGFVAEGMALGNAVIVGVALVAAALGAIFVPRAWEEWTECLLALWLIISPWALAYSGIQAATLNAVITGIAIGALSLWTLLIDDEYRKSWLSDRAAH